MATGAAATGVCLGLGFLGIYALKNVLRWRFLRFLVGAIAGFILVVAAGLVAGYQRSPIENGLLTEPAVAALKKYDPGAFAQMRRDIEEAVARKTQLRKASAKVRSIYFTPAVNRALRETSNKALADFMRTKVTVYEALRREDAQTCVDAMLRRNSQVVAFALERLPADVRNAIRNANVRVLEDAVAGGRVIVPVDRARAEVVRDAIDERLLRSRGVSVDALFDDSNAVTAVERCEAGIAFLHEALTQPEPKRAVLLRYLATDG